MHGPTHLEDAEIAPPEAAEGVCDVKLIDSCAKASGVKVNSMIQCLRTQLKEVRAADTTPRHHGNWRPPMHDAALRGREKQSVFD